MAIARVASDKKTEDVGGASSITLSYTVASGSNRLMVAGGAFQTGGPFVSFAFNGDTGTIDKIETDLVGGNVDGVFSLVNPDVATGNAVITKTSSGNQMDIAVANYTGCKQTGQPDATGSAYSASASGLSYTVTTVADGCWIMTMISNNVGGAITGTSNYAGLQIPRNGLEFGDSNASVGSAGAKTVSFTGGSGRWWAASASYSPAPPGIKTVDGLAYASVKTVNGLAVASVKSIMGLE